MATSTLIALGIVFTVLIAIFFINYLEKKNYIKISQEELEKVISLFQLSMEVVDELNLKEEPLIKKIADIVVDSLELFKDRYTDKEEAIKEITAYVIRMCGVINIPMTEQRQKIIETFVKIGIDNILK